jgi:RNase P/RNase MRP subunit p30
MSEILGIDTIGLDYYYEKLEGGEGRKDDHSSIIYRMNREQQQQLLSLQSSAAEVTNYPYLVVSEKIDEISSFNGLDILVVKDFKKINDNNLKMRIKKCKIGLEVTLADLRKNNGLYIAKQFNQIRYIYKFCKFNNCQFIISSGASSILEMVSGPSLDSILRICDIKPANYWQELAEWIELRCRDKVNGVFINT